VIASGVCCLSLEASAKGDGKDKNNGVDDGCENGLVFERVYSPLTRNGKVNLAKIVKKTKRIPTPENQNNNQSNDTLKSSQNTPIDDDIEVAELD
jgi:hypothetical protein